MSLADGPPSNPEHVCPAAPLAGAAKGGKPGVVTLKHIPALDGVRGLAILGVLLVHTRPDRDTLSGAGILLYKLLEGGIYGVDLFFVLSGFLITGILLDSRDSPAYFRTFYVRRFLRLFPVYYLYLFMTALVFPVLHHLAKIRMPDYHGSWWWYVLYLSNWKPKGGGMDDPYLGHFWSLAVEEQFYLFWSVLVFFLPDKRKLAIVCVVILGAAPMLRAAAVLAGADWNVTYRLTPMRLDALDAGAIAAILFRSRGAISAWFRKTAFLNFAAAGALFLIVCAFSGGLEWQHFPVQTVGESALVLSFASLVYFAAHPDGGRLSAFLNQAWLRSFGKYSYAIYVYHVAIAAHLARAIASIQRRLGNTSALGFELFLTAATIALSYGLGKISWRYFESRFLALKARFSY